jgi:hypothetical protein
LSKAKAALGLPFFIGAHGFDSCLRVLCLRKPLISLLRFIAWIGAADGLCGASPSWLLHLAQSLCIYLGKIVGNIVNLSFINKEMLIV